MGQRGGQMAAVFAAFEEHRPSQEHQYLDLLATRPTDRGRGVGMALLAVDLAELDAIGRRVPGVVQPGEPGPLRSVGFRRLDAFALPYGGPVIDTMWRDPR